jgi:hypothetical protein
VLGDMMAMQGDLDENDPAAVAEARDLVDRAQQALPESLEEDVAPMLDLMARGIDAAEDGGDPNEVFASDEETAQVAREAASALDTYQSEECE